MKVETVVELSHEEIVNLIQTEAKSKAEIKASSSEVEIFQVSNGTNEAIKIGARVRFNTKAGLRG